MATAEPRRGCRQIRRGSYWRVKILTDEAGGRDSPATGSVANTLPVGEPSIPETVKPAASSAAAAAEPLWPTTSGTTIGRGPSDTTRGTELPRGTSVPGSTPALITTPSATVSL